MMRPGSRAPHRWLRPRVGDAGPVEIHAPRDADPELRAPGGRCAIPSVTGITWPSAMWVTAASRCSCPAFPTGRGSGPLPARVS